MNPLRGLRILVVDDDDVVRALYVMVLRHAGAIVTSSRSAMEALQLSESEPPDVVLTDLVMPDHDGIWLLRELKGRMPAVHVILVSGNAESIRRPDLLNLGFAEILVKPVPLSELVASISRLRS